MILEMSPRPTVTTEPYTTWSHFSEGTCRPVPSLHPTVLIRF